MDAAHRQGVSDRGRHVALTKGAITVAVIGAVVHEGVRDAAGVTCGTGGSLSPLVAPVPGLHGHWAQSSSHHPCPGTR